MKAKSVNITLPAERSLNYIYHYFLKEVSAEVAVRVVDRILNRIELLEENYHRGRLVEELRVLNQDHRYVIEGPYKIIYRVIAQSVFVTDIFSMYQDPKRIIERS
ncbi:type II toxin-antitoxin system RelE/ParE family toxin [Roseivirga sp.]|uniref:type II toxin-antitoxin system RelE/ParE family toxin n=1 Tax=Roseivirga sp. TaxID=1964215 RepID=UPI003B518B0D